MNTKIQDIIIQHNESILFALKKMDQVHRKLLIISDGDRFLSLVSIGDIQRAIINNIDINTNIRQILRQQVTVAYSGDDIQAIKKKMLERHNEFMPILSETGELEDVIFWEDLFQNQYKPVQEKIKLPVVIMAGGKGARLKPLTNVLPKPLIPIQNKTMIEDIMDRFVDCGSNEFHISLNYKANMIRHYLDNLGNDNYILNYFQEERPLGTAGSLHLLKEQIKSTFFVSNCDILIDENYTNILKYHEENNNEITLVAALKHYNIPYGTVSTKENGLLKKLTEKPELTFKINTGFYILEPQLIDEIPKNTFYHITDLIEKLNSQNRRVGVFPVSEKSWLDIGNWKEYQKIIKTIFSD